MDLTINNKISKSNQTKDEINNFMEELRETIKLEQDIVNAKSIYKEIYREIPLASKYAKELKEIIDKCMENLSYENDFFYFDYDKKQDKYFLDYYCDGKIEKIEISKEDAKEDDLKEGMFYDQYAGKGIVETEFYKDYVKSNVDSELNMLNAKRNNI